MDKRCPHCRSRSSRLIITACNRWMGEDKILMQLDEADLTALRGRVETKLVTEARGVSSEADTLSAMRFSILETGLSRCGA